jgi:hypothetical protein
VVAKGRAIAAFDGVRVLLNGVAEHVSTAETTLIFAEADQLKKFQADCVKRLTDAREPLAALERAGAEQTIRLAKAKEVDAAMCDNELSCSWETLHARDRVLEGLRSFAPGTPWSTYSRVIVQPRETQ